MSPSFNSSAFLSHLSTLETTLQSASTPPLSLSSHLQSLLSLLPTTASVSFPSRRLQTFLNSLLSVSPPPPLTLLLPSATLLVSLVSISPILYDELLFSSTLHRVLSPLKRATKSSNTKSSSSLGLPAPDNHLSITPFTNYFQAIAQLCANPHFDVSNQSFTSLLFSAIADLLTFQHLPISSLLTPIMNVLLPRSDHQLRAHLYRSLLPLTRTSLPLQSHRILRDVVLRVVAVDVENDNVNHTLRFLQLCVLHVVDRANQRAALVQLLHSVLDAVPQQHATLFTPNLARLLTHPKGRVRVFVMEALPSLVFNDPQKDQHHINKWITIIGPRCHDRVPMVRLKAITALSIAVRTYGIDGELGVLGRKGADRLADPKVRVRKAAVELLGTVGRHIVTTGQYSDQVLRVAKRLKSRCADVAASVRMGVCTQLTSMVLGIGEHSEQWAPRLVAMWAETIGGMMSDVDARCKETVLKATKAVFLGGAGWDDAAAVSDFAQREVGKMTLTVMGAFEPGLRDLLKTAFHVFCRNATVDIKYLKKLCKLVKERETEDIVRGAWTALAEIALCGKSHVIERELSMDLIMKEAVTCANRDACKIAQSFVDVIPENAKQHWSAMLHDNIFSKMRMKNELLDRDWLPAALGLLSALHPERGEQFLETCRVQIVDLTADDQLHADENSKLVENLLVVVGGICLSFAMRSAPPESILTFVRALASNTMEDSRLRALSITTLGKICLTQSVDAAEGRSKKKDVVGTLNRVGESLARRNISIFVHELDMATSSATRINSVFVLCDLCRIYTAVVEPYLPRLASLLSDPSETVRVHVLTSLVRLLQEDYIKVRGGAVLYQIADCLLDSCERVRSTAEYCLLHVMTPKNGAVLSTSFIELIFTLNNCKECDVYKHTKSSPRKSRFEDIADGNFDMRMKIYDVFLRGMTMEQRLRLPGRFTTDIVGLIVDSKLDLSKNTVQAVLRDALLLLCSSKIRVIGGWSDADGELDEDIGSQTDGGGVKATALGKKLRLLNKVQMVILRESTVPALLEIRHRLEDLRSPLLKVLMGCFCTLLKPHKSDLGSIIRDSVIRSEILHEMSKGTSHLNVLGKECNKKRTTEMHGASLVTPRRLSLASSRAVRSPSEMKVMSVPRTKRSKRVSILQVHNLSDGESDEDVIPEVLSKRKSFQLRRRMAASPKLAAIVGKSEEVEKENECEMQDVEQESGFSQTMQRLEEEAMVNG